MKVSANLRRAEARLRTHALTYPGAVEEFPWGHRAIKIKGKMFVVMALDDGELTVSVKLPGSNMAALMLPFASPTGYGMGRSGWVTARFGAKDKPPIDLLTGWIDESFRAIAPKSVVKELAATKPSGTKRPSRSKA